LIHTPAFCFQLSFQIESNAFVQARLKHNPPPSAFGEAGIAGMSHHAWLSVYFLNFFVYFLNFFVYF
jgi:hypothetical protein